MHKIPPVIIVCINETCAREFGTWLGEQGWIHDVERRVVTIVGSYAGFAVEMTDRAVVNKWTTPGGGLAALNSFQVALNAGQDRK